MQAPTPGPRRTPAIPATTASPLVRQLARLRPGPPPQPPAQRPLLPADRLLPGDRPLPAHRQPLAERLAPWLGLTDAIALAAALAPAPTRAAAPAGALSAAPAPAAAGDDAAAAARLRERLAAGLADAVAPPPARRPGAGAARAEDETDFTPHRRRYHARQQAMALAVAPLRAHLRERLAARSPALARLAAVDAVMEQALAERERGLLAGVPVLLAQRFEQLRQAAAEAPATPATPGAPAWLVTFRHDMHQLLLAELDHRWQPIEGLLAALSHDPAP